MNISVTKQLTRIQFDELIEKDSIDYYETNQSDVYRIKLNKSFLKCVIQKTDEGVQIIYLKSKYEQPEHKIKLLAFAGFVIARKINDNRDFSEITFNNNGDIIKFEQ